MIEKLQLHSVSLKDFILYYLGVALAACTMIRSSLPKSFAWEQVLHCSKSQLSANQILLVDKSSILPRLQTIQWILQVTTKANLSSATSDSAIQMMDRYYAHRISSDIATTTESYETDCGMAASSSLILSSKLHETRPLSASSFPFEEAQLVQFECHLLHILRFDIVPQMAPSMLVRQMFSLWLEPLPMGMTSMVIMKLTDTLINQFWKQSSADSLRFAPSTIAISALLLAFSKCKIDCGAWLQRLPDGLFPPKSSSSLTPHRIFAIHEQSFLDIDACLLAMMGEERTDCLSSQQQRGTSHTHTKQQDIFCHTPTHIVCYLPFFHPAHDDRKLFLFFNFIDRIVCRQIIPVELRYKWYSLVFLKI